MPVRIRLSRAGAKKRPFYRIVIADSNGNSLDFSYYVEPIVHDIDISGQPSGSAMRWKVVTANQDANKYTNIQAVSLGWS